VFDVTTFGMSMRARTHTRTHASDSVHLNLIYNPQNCLNVSLY